MLAYHNPEWTKAKIMAQMRAHAEADELIQGTGWENGKGCMIGCLFHEYNHSKGPLMIGFPSNLLHLCDKIFENLPNDEAKRFALALPEAVTEGADLSMVADRWLLWLLAESGVRDLSDADGKSAIDTVIGLLERAVAGDTPTSEEWDAAEAAAWDAAGDVTWAAAGDAAWAAAWAGAKAAAEAAAAEAAAAGAAAWKSYATKLVDLCKTAPIPTLETPRANPTNRR